MTDSPKKNLTFVKPLLFGVFSITYLILLLPLVSGKIQLAAISIAQPYVQQDKKFLAPAATTVKSGGDRQISLSIATQPKYISGDRNSVKATDARVIALYNFLLDYNSPMYPYAENFVTEADKYDADWRLVVSISGVESAFGRLIPQGSFNGWGWKGDPTQAWSHFDGWPDAIATVTERMALGYGTDLTPFEIEPTYCPPCGANPAHAWANGVTNYMNSLNIYLAEVEGK